MSNNVRSKDSGKGSNPWLFTRIGNRLDRFRASFFRDKSHAYDISREIIDVTECSFRAAINETECNQIKCAEALVIDGVLYASRQWLKKRRAPLVDMRIELGE